ncbi:hypothetical protein [uncultured Methanobrevibacter sp.]|uniref:hypothetical protein n=1 Tax=uncultured Methanobrevibacter sp. TaxID=253161 RepID=UPI0025CE76F8|nr:hypothetical protein [uncultured Methanobrevibacter sp.]
MATPTMLFLTFNDIDNRWKVVDNEQFCFGDGETQAEAIASARLVSDATIFSDTEPDLIVDRVFEKLFLELQNDSKFHVVDENGCSYGQHYELIKAIKEARKITASPIDIEDSHAGFSRLCVPEKQDNAEEDSEVFIQMLAELAGMKVTKLFDDNLHFMGYTMEPIDKDLQEFIAAEDATEKAEEQLQMSFDCYFKEE